MASAGPIAVSAGLRPDAGSRTAPLLPDLLLAMMGYRGDIFEAAPDAAPGASRVRLSPWVDWVSSAEREQLERLARLGDLFVELQAFARWAQHVDLDDEDDDWEGEARGATPRGEPATLPGRATGEAERPAAELVARPGADALAPRPGPLTAALGAAAEELLEAYAAEVESLSARLDAPPPPPPTALLERLAEFERALPAALELLKAATGWGGAALEGRAAPSDASLSLPPGAFATAGASGTGFPISPWSPIEAACSSGDPVLEAVAGRLHRRLRAALWRLVEAWAGHGALLEGGWVVERAEADEGEGEGSGVPRGGGGEGGAAAGGAAAWAGAGRKGAAPDAGRAGDAAALAVPRLALSSSVADPSSGRRAAPAPISAASSPFAPRVARRPPPASLFVVAGSRAMALRAARPPRDARDVDAAEWHGGFAVDPRLLPASFSRQAAEDVLFAGRAARALAACGARDRAEPGLWGGADAWGPDGAAQDDVIAGHRRRVAFDDDWDEAREGGGRGRRPFDAGREGARLASAADDLSLEPLSLFDRSRAASSSDDLVGTTPARPDAPASCPPGGADDPTPQLFGAFASPERAERAGAAAKARRATRRSSSSSSSSRRAASPLAALGALLLSPTPPPAPLVRRACAEVRRAAAAALARAIARDADLAARLSALSDAFLMRRAGLCAAFLDEARATLAAPPRPAEAAAAASRALLAAAAGAGPAADACLAEVAFVFGAPDRASGGSALGVGTANRTRGESGAAPAAASASASGLPGAAPAPMPPPLDAWDSLALAARPGWPLRLFVSPASGRSYEAVWKLVFRLARVERALDDAWTAVRGWRRGRVARGAAQGGAERPGAGGAGAGAALAATSAPPPGVLRRACALRARMAHVARTIRAHVQADVAGTLWEELRARLRRARDFGEADAAHDAYVAGLVRGALLDDPALMRVLGGILAGSLEFAKRLRAAGEGDAGPAEPLGARPARLAAERDPEGARSDRLAAERDPEGARSARQAAQRDPAHAHLAATVEVAAREFRLQYSIFLRLLAGSRPGGAERAPGVRRLLLKLDYDGAGMRDAALWEG